MISPSSTLPRWPPPDREVEKLDLFGLTIESDLPTCTAVDRVFPLFEDESIYLASTIEVGPGERVLDLGTGSGLLALVSAMRGAKVIGTDINPLALSCAAYNAEKNGLSSIIEWRLCHLFDGLPSEHFDLVLANPPFLPVPSGISMFVSSDAGEHGLKVIEPFLRGVRSVLRPGGRVSLLGLSFEDASGLVIESLAKGAFSAPSDSVRLLDIYGYALPVGNLCALFGPNSVTSAWLAELQMLGFKGVRYVLLELCREGALPACRRRPKFGNSQFSGRWRSRLSRYRDMAWVSFKRKR